VSWLTYGIGRAMVRLPFFSLVNLLAKRQVVPELLQREVTVNRVVAELEKLWQGPARETCLQGLDEVRAALGQPGASTRAAALVARFIQSN
jgi:lipid-A-disaccharide synthase